MIEYKWALGNYIILLTLNAWDKDNLFSSHKHNLFFLALKE